MAFAVMRLSKRRAVVSGNVVCLVAAHGVLPAKSLFKTSSFAAESYTPTLRCLSRRTCHAHAHQRTRAAWKRFSWVDLSLLPDSDGVVSRPGLMSFMKTSSADALLTRHTIKERNVSETPPRDNEVRELLVTISSSRHGGVFGASKMVVWRQSMPPCPREAPRVFLLP